MDLEDPLLSHQVESVNELSKYFVKVTVITGRVGLHEVSGNVRVLSSDWTPGNPIKSGVRFVLLASSVIRRNRNIVVFSHMTEVQSAMLAIPLRILGISHYLWYAHAQKSLFLIINHFFANGIITSTKGSCPISSNKVFPVGQAINVDNFKISNKKLKKAKSLVHIGRFDQSKDIHGIIDAVNKVMVRNHLELTFTQIGSPTTEVARAYCEQTHQKFASQIEEGWLKLQPSILRSEVPSTLSNYDAFTHAYKGSLDKSIVEATLVGIPVLTTNPEYLAIFGSWSRRQQDSVTLENEIESYIGTKQADIENEIIRRRLIALQGHSLKNWGLQISRILPQN
jgi:glycosyltransferase involved in cell wall biosynthesis